MIGFSNKKQNANSAIEIYCGFKTISSLGKTGGYDWDSGYTCHQLGSGAIVVQLAQPYVVASMRLLLWDCDDRSYSYYIEVSTNQRSWEMVCNRSREKCKSWVSNHFIYNYYRKRNKLLKNCTVFYIYF